MAFLEIVVYSLNEFIIIDHLKVRQILWKVIEVRLNTSLCSLFKTL